MASMEILKTPSFELAVNLEGNEVNEVVGEFVNWMALFVSLGWNFLDYGFVSLLHGGTWDVSWALCGFI